MRIPIFSGKGVFWGVVSGKFPRKPIPEIGGILSCSREGRGAVQVMGNEHIWVILQ